MSKITHAIPSLDLALSGVVLEDGKFKQGWVENGNWMLVLSGQEWQAKAGHEIVNRWPVRPEDELLDVPAAHAHSYNAACAWAATQINKKGN